MKDIYNKGGGKSMRCLLFGHKPSKKTHTKSLQELLSIQSPRDHEILGLVCTGDTTFKICQRCKKWLLNKKNNRR